ncbi:hypothetical protein SAMD00023353_0402080 [Rosellinia necatrix]|uniref:Uncharacterized protein n=1 Tax=Rosellinia necatrix TaxID=77044 RepID=A0A1S7UIY5_ROSNE|nr:hypothetical protein SAMD00023353_0402080 [Rosellinia necatrix]
MFRQPEERTYKLSAVDDFALRPKKKETTTESVKPKAHTDQRSPHRGEGHRNNSSRQTPPSSKPPPSTNSDGNNRPGSFAIDSHHKSRMPSEGTLDLPHGKKDVALDERRRWEESRQRQPDGAPQPQQRLVVDQGSRDLHVQDSPQNIASSAPSIKPNLNPAQGVSFQPPPPNRQTPNIPNFSKPLGPARMDSTYQQSIPPTRGHQLLNGARQLPPDRKISTPISSNRGLSETEGIMTKEPTEPAAPQPQIAGIIPHPLSGTQPSAPSVEHLPVPEKVGQPPTPMNSQGPLSALLGGRKWGKMSPEERRLFWVSQHDPTEFDNQIYSENNRPFRPGDALFGVVDNIRPTRLATHFAYIDPRTHYSRQYPDQWYQRKQEEILARGNRKVELGETIKRAVRRRQSASNSDPQQNTLPQYVRNNPTWLAAVKVLDGFASQAKNKEINTHRQEDTHKGKAKQTTDVERDSDADIESS